ncbi:Solute carrier organic anion transporter family member 3A1 [Trichinella pseudospiralis]|uniref:Solute carrier organic anion transporter family member 3A1 n=1 Tax=Trichinella pseudospiralis TaxID=6337 RepID=A0A0V1FKI4_TRIPS|nr:Solute carrier organic anion transporter family member 3A1 [Trichinella pseudospiralis]
MRCTLEISTGQPVVVALASFTCVRVFSKWLVLFGFEKCSFTGNISLFPIIIYCRKSKLLIMKRQSKTRSWLCWMLREKFSKWTNIRLFSFIMCVVIAIQGAYLGYIVGVLTNIEKRFEISSSHAGTLLSMYDIGHTLTVLFVGYFLADCHKPRITGIGVMLSSLAMFLLALPNFIFGPRVHQNFDQLLANNATALLVCHENDMYTNLTNPSTVDCEETFHYGAYSIIAFAQLLAGISAAPFNTIAYIYIDDNDY